MLTIKRYETERGLSSHKKTKQVIRTVLHREIWKSEQSQSAAISAYVSARLESAEKRNALRNPISKFPFYSPDEFLFPPEWIDPSELCSQRATQSLHPIRSYSGTACAENCEGPIENSIDEELRRSYRELHRYVQSIWYVLPAEPSPKSGGCAAAVLWPRTPGPARTNASMHAQIIMHGL
jgi:hypothetical protein